ncbi:hypothetical protein [Streptomyces apocyni]|uniref:hypothetical protein n=1 Tax=Streptomyces apocyni TaxID=2654677 RepID=UPI0012EAAAE5|nr:hypothetical protein [Streptomyces apocyni]
MTPPTPPADSAGSPPAPPTPPGSSHWTDLSRAPGWVMLVAAVLLLLSSTVAVWWVVGQRTLDEVADPDHAVRPWDIPAGVETTVGAGALLTLVLTASLFVEWTRTRRMDPVWWSALGPLLGVGVAVALGHRVVTAEVIGANIGAGFIVLFGAPVVALVGVMGLGRAVQLALRGRRRRT